MSYAAVSRLGESDPFLAGCTRDQVVDLETGRCVAHHCPYPEAPYYGTCLTVEVQQELARVHCLPEEHQTWHPGTASCACMTGYVYRDGRCHPAGTQPPAYPVPASAWERRDVEQAEDRVVAQASVRPLEDVPWWLYAAGAGLLLSAGIYYARG